MGSVRNAEYAIGEGWTSPRLEAIGGSKKLGLLPRIDCSLPPPHPTLRPNRPDGASRRRPIVVEQRPTCCEQRPLVVSKATAQPFASRCSRPEELQQQSSIGAAAGAARRRFTLARGCGCSGQVGRGLRPMCLLRRRWRSSSSHLRVWYLARQCATWAAETAACSTLRYTSSAQRGP